MLLQTSPHVNETLLQLIDVVQTEIHKRAVRKLDQEFKKMGRG